MIVLDAGVLGKPYFNADISREEVSKAGGSNIKELIEVSDSNGKLLPYKKLQIK